MFSKEVMVKRQMGNPVALLNEAKWRGPITLHFMPIVAKPLDMIRLKKRLVSSR